MVKNHQVKGGTEVSKKWLLDWKCNIPIIFNPTEVLFHELSLLKNQYRVTEFLTLYSDKPAVFKAIQTKY